ncbi:MAG: DNA primase [Candidatus Verstraetearchaeota archaeon]|jgi:DNA primase|nr:DNA primase [Candidatus Verstraetearchaeota archaeon]
MGGAPVTAKYNVIMGFEVDGVVEKPDIIGAIFGQTEGLLGEELDLRELQRTGRISRIEVKINSEGGKTTGEIIIPSSLDKAETALIVAAIEVIDKVGPCSAKFYLKSIEDLREKKREQIIERAKEILNKWKKESNIDTQEILDKIMSEIRASEIIKFGEEGLPAGPGVAKDDTIIIVEGRADVINLLKHGYKNVIAIEGASIPKTIIELSKKKNTIAFVDGDRAGELILKELLQVADIDYVAQAPPGKEVEELTAKEIVKCLSNMIPAKEYLELQMKRPSIEKVKVALPENIIEKVKEHVGTLKASLYDEKGEKIKETSVRDLINEMQQQNKIYGIIFDGVVTQRIVDLAGEKNVKYIIGARIGSIIRRPPTLTILTFDDILTTT